MLENYLKTDGDTQLLRYQATYRRSHPAIISLTKNTGLKLAGLFFTERTWYDSRFTVLGDKRRLLEAIENYKRLPVVK